MYVWTSLATPVEFQFTPLREGRLLSGAFILHRPLFQFTPLREGRLKCRVVVEVVKNFNSRPSARGDMLKAEFLRARIISIHAPPRGATRVAALEGGVGYFNSRPSARGDKPEVRTTAPFISISIHAPPRGATRYRHIQITLRLTFQFTPLREGRLGDEYTRAVRCNFNSRPSARGDITPTFRKFPFELFQFTPLREGRRT